MGRLILPISNQPSAYVPLDISCFTFLLLPRKHFHIAVHTVLDTAWPCAVYRIRKTANIKVIFHTSCFFSKKKPKKLVICSVVEFGFAIQELELCCGKLGTMWHVLHRSSDQMIRRDLSGLKNPLFYFNLLHYTMIFWSREIASTSTVYKDTIIQCGNGAQRDC